MEESSTYSPTQALPSCSRALEFVFWILYGSIGVIIFAGNFFTLVIFVSTKRLRQSYMNIFLLSLAVADVMMAVCVVPFVVLCVGCNTSSKFCWLMAGLKDIALGATVLSLAAISLDRFLAVVRPLRYQSEMTSKRMTCILFGVWSFSCSFAFIRQSWIHTKTADEALRIDMIYYSTLSFVFVLLPILVILGMNIKIIQAIRRQSGRIHRQRNGEDRASEETNPETRLERNRARRGTLSCILVVFIFLISWLPLAFTNFNSVFGRPELVTPTLLKVAWLLLFLQSSVNPFIYWYYRSEFRQAAYKLIGCKFTGIRAVPIERRNDDTT